MLHSHSTYFSTKKNRNEKAPLADRIKHAEHFKIKSSKSRKDRRKDLTVIFFILRAFTLSTTSILPTEKKKKTKKTCNKVEAP